MAESRSYEHEDLDIKVTDAKGRNYYPLFSFERTWRIDVDPNYGADADGNRGMRMEFIEDDRYNDLEIGGVPIEAFTPEWRKLLEGALEDWMERNQPE